MTDHSRGDSRSDLRYTPFPDLYPCRPNRRGRHASRVTIESLFAPDETLLISWAILLNKYTLDDQPIFCSDEVSLQFKSDSRSLDRLSHDVVGGDPFTGVYFSLAQARIVHDQDLVLLYNSKTGIGELRSNGCVPSYHLKQLGLQLKSALTEASHLDSRLVGDVPPASPALSILNPTPKCATGPNLLHQLLGWHSPTKDVAIDFLSHHGDRKSLTWDQLDRASSKLARDIQVRLSFHRKATDGTPVVPVLIPQSLELYVAQLAILKAGCAFCPLSLDAPEERIRFILRDVSAILIVTVEAQRARLLDHGCISILDATLDYEVPTEWQPPDIDPTSIAYVMYTSGSTGEPKGVTISHRAVTQALLAHDYHVPTFHRFLQFASPTFDVSVFEIFFPLFRGKTLVGCERSTMLNDLNFVINSMDVDAIELTPTVAGSLLQRRENVLNLQLLLTIGEMLTRNVIEEFGESPDRRGILYGMYGPTEASIHCTLQQNFRTDHKVGIIGIPLSTVSTFVLAPTSADMQDRSQIKILPIGQIGELAVGGSQLANGYLHRPDQTSAVFVETHDHGQLYRTGDKARLLPDGSLECLGRITTGQVKLRGQRIELGEIEEAVLRDPACHAAVACVINGIIVVFCLAREGELDTESIYQLCRKWLPAFMVPGDIAILPELPHLSSGKVDRARLMEQYRTHNFAGTDEDALKNEAEAAVLAIAQDILGGSLGVTGVLGQHGLDSLQAIRFASLLRRDGFSADTSQILNSRSVRELTRHLSDKDGSEARTSEIANEQGLIDRLTTGALENENIAQHRSELLRVLPCSPLQNALLVETFRDHDAYWNWIELELDPQYSEQQIRDVLTHLADENEILRSGFCETDEPAYPVGLVVWRSMASSQVREVDEFSREHSGSINALLRGFNAQVLPARGSVRILVQIHHGLYDGWSMDLIIRDIDRLLQGEIIPPRPQYHDVTRYHLSKAHLGDKTSDRFHWQERLSGVHPCLLPNLSGKKHQPKPLERFQHNSSVHLEQLQARAKDYNFSPQVYFQAAFAYLLASYTGANDVIVGTVSSGRTLPVTGIEEIIGPCIATLPLRIDVAQSRRSLDLLRAIHRLNREMLEHCTLPLRDIKNCCGLQPGRPLFDTMLIWQQSLVSSSEPNVVHVVDSMDYHEFNLLLELEPRKGSLHVRATFQPSLIPRSQMQILLAQIDCLVSRMLIHDHEALEQVHLCFPLEQLSIENAVPSRMPFENGVSALVQAQASSTSGAPALAFASKVQDSGVVIQTLTYAELNDRANQLAHYLRSRGVKRDMLVGICLEKSIELYVCILATMYVGAGYLPFTPSTPLERMKSIIKEADIMLFLSKGATFGHLSRLEQTETIDLDSLNDDLSRRPTRNLDIPHEESDIAYAVFTSGSTGTPKGVLVTQQNLSSNIKTLMNMYPVAEHSNLLQACSQAFDVSVFEIFFAWSTGMCLCSASEDVLFQDIERIIRNFSVTHLSLTPTVAALIDPVNVPSVRFLVTSGEAVTEHVFQTWATHGLWQGYGPSETTNICTVKPTVAYTDMVNNIGSPFPNTSAFVVSKDTGFELVFRGGVGELCFGGDQIFKGYLKMPELNSKKIVDHPKYGRIYRSGDLGRLLPDGSILFEGRVDGQVKLRGQRVELGEVNSAVLSANGVRDCFSTIIQQSVGLPQRLVTFWVSKNHSQMDFNVIPAGKDIGKSIHSAYEVMRAVLPAYMIPVSLVPVSQLPRTSQGKIDERRLAAVYNDLKPESLNRYAEPSVGAHINQDWTVNEEKIASIIAEVLNVTTVDVGRHTSFFSLGLDSISAISAARSLRKKIGVNLDISTVLKCSSVSRLSTEMADTTRKRSDAEPMMQENKLQVFSRETLDTVESILKPKGKSVQKILPCTPLQEAMLSLGLISSSYQNSTVFRVHGDIARLKYSWQEVCRRHDILRTQFLPTNDRAHAYAQVVFLEAELPWIESEAATISFDSLQGQITDRHLHQNERDPDLPYSLVDMKVKGTHYLMLTMHHALYDALAMEQLLHEVELLYFAEEKLPDSISFEPFLIAGLSMDQTEADKFWTKQFSDFTPTKFPSLYRKPEADDTSESAYNVTSQILDIPLKELESACKATSTTMLSITQAAFAKILSMYLGCQDICFGNVVSGRSLPIDGVERLVAPCFNTLPVRANLASASTNVELTQDLKRYNTDVLPFQLSPLRRVQAQACPGGKRLFDTLFILQQTPKELNHGIWSVEKDYGEMTFPLVLELIPNVRENTILTTLHYDSYSIPPRDVRYVFEAFEDSLRSCMIFPSASVSDLLSAIPVRDTAVKNTFVLFSDGKSSVPEFGIGDLYSQDLDGKVDRRYSTSINRNGKTFYKTGKLARLLPDDEYVEIEVKRDYFGGAPSTDADPVQDDANSDWTDVELCIRDTIAQLAHTSTNQIKKLTTIYKLGLDSINAVQLAAKLREKGLEISASDMMEHPTCSGLASFLRQRRPSQPAVTKIDLDGFNAQFRSAICTEYHLDEADVHRVRPCTPLQSGLLSESIRSQTGLYLNEIKLRLHNDTNLEQFRHAWVVVQQKYAILRSGFAHVTNSNFPMAMIEYTSSAATLPWHIFTDVDLIQEIIKKNGADIMNSLHQGPWSVLLFASEGNHTLILLAHHALYDAQLLQNIFDDVAKAYGGYDLSIASPLEPSIVEILEKSQDDTERNREFWEEMGKDMAISRFPNLTPLVVKDGQRYVESRKYVKGLTELEDDCRVVGTTMQAVAQSAWAQILSRLAGEAAVTFGVVFSGRTTDSTEHAPFPCISTVPIPCRVTDDGQRLLRDMLDCNARMQRHQFTPLPRIQRWTGHSDEAVFDTILTYQKRTTGSLRIAPPWNVEDEQATVNYAVSIELDPSFQDDSLHIRMATRDDVVPRAQARLILEQIEDSFLGLLSTAYDLVDRVGIYRDRLLSITPAKEPKLSSEVQLLHEYVERMAKEHPERAALEFAMSLDDAGAKQWNYSQIDEAGNRVAHLLHSHGIKPGELVATCFDKSPEASFAFIGILKTGCAFVALDPTAPLARNSFIIEDSRTRVVLSTKKLAADLPQNASLSIVELDSCRLESWPANPVKLPRKIHPTDLSYCLYTSGTTGTPKGCMISHENVVQAFLSFQRLFSGHWNQESRWLQFASFHFDVSVLEQFWSWSVGICVVSAPRDLIFEDIAEAIRRLRITHIDLTPSLAKILQPDDVPSLCKGVFITGGEQLKQEIIDTWGPKGVIYNGYGPTEATIGVTMFPRVPANGKPSNIGRQFDNVGTYVLQPNSDTAVLRGGVGELCVTGKLIGKGYLNRPELTNERFPFLERYGERVYRTGDLVRILHGDTFIFLGRIDDQVKLRGQRLEVAEVNNVIRLARPDLADVSTLVLTHPKQQRDHLASFIVAKKSTSQEEQPRVLVEGQRTLIQSLQEACETKLPSYMIPTYFIPISVIPLTVNNKVDNRKLQEVFAKMSLPDLQRLSQRELDTPSFLVPIERRIATVLAGFLSISSNEICGTTSIFELGLDSISAIGFTRALKDAGFPNCDVSIVMNNARVGSLARAITDSTPTDRSGAVIAAKQSIAAYKHKHMITAAKVLGIYQDDIEALAPCTPLQEGIISTSLGGMKPSYFGYFPFELRGDVDCEKLKRAWFRTFEAAQILRTRFVLTTDGYMQVVVKQLPLPWIEQSFDSEAQVDQSLQRRAEEWADENRDTFAKPWEVILVHCPTKTVMTLHMFHALYDGVSIRLILDAVTRGYTSDEALQLGPAFHDALPHGPMREIDGAQSFWTQHLSSVKPSQLKTLVERPSRSDCLTTVDIGRLGKFDAVRQSLGVTEQALFQACWAYVLLPHLGSNVIFGNIISGRSFDLKGVDRVIGPLFNTIPFGLQLQKDDTWNSVIQKCHQFNVSALPYQHTPLRDILKWCKCDKEHPLFEVLFVFQKETLQPEASRNIFRRELETEFRADFPLALEVERKSSESFKFTIAARSDIADAEKCLQILQTLESALRNLLENPNVRIAASISKLQDASNWKHANGGSRNLDTKVNGVSGHFQWTPQAQLLRTEISRIANLEADQIDEHCSILELGLDSIDAIRLSSSLKKSEMTLSVNSIMRYLTIRKMMQHVSTKEIDGATKNHHHLLASRGAELAKCLYGGQKKPETIERVLPVTPLQEAMLSEMMSSNFERYFNHDVLKISKNIDTAYLQSAWERAFEILPVLRTSFAPIEDPYFDDAFAQVVHKHSIFPWDEISHDMADDFSTLTAQITEDVRDNFLEQPPIKLTVVHCSEETYLILSLSHAMYDGRSLQLLHETVHKCYAESKAAEEIGQHTADADSNPSGAQRTYGNALQQILMSLTEEGEAFWQYQVAGYTPSALPRRELGPCEISHGVHRGELHSQISLEQITYFCRAHGVTLQAFGASCWSFVLASLYRKLDVVFGVVLSGRDTPDTESAIFPTMNTVCVRSIIHGTKQDMLQYMQGIISDIMTHQHFPLRKIQALTPHRGERLFDTLFIYQKRLSTGTLSQDPLYESVGGASDVEYPVCVEMETVGDALVWRAACHDDVFNAVETKEVLQNLDSVMMDIVRDSSTSALDFSKKGTSICGLQPFQPVAYDDRSTNSAPTRSDLHDPAWSDNERKVRSVLSTVSKISELEITQETSIFHLGVDSISAMKVAALLRRQDVQLAVSEILQADSLKNIALLADGAETRDTNIPNTNELINMKLEAVSSQTLIDSANINANDVEKILPTSPGQDYMLSRWQNTEGTSFFPEFVWKVEGCDDLQRVREAWLDLVHQTPILRTCFIASGHDMQSFIQLVLREVNSNLFSIEDSPSVNGRRALLGVAQPLLRLSARVAEDEISLRLHIHHALYDAVSLPILRQNLEDIINGGMDQPRSIRDPAQFLALGLSQEARSKCKDFWENYLADFMSPTLLQPSFSSPTRVELFKPALITKKPLENLARTHGVSAQAVFLAVWSRLYASLLQPSNPLSSTKNYDVVFGIYIANRSHLPNLDMATFPTLNLVPLRVRSSSSDLIDVARQIQIDLREISTAENSAVSLWEIDGWTEGRVKLDCFVNFLSLPENEVEEDNEAREVDPRPVKVTEVNDHALRERREVIEPQETHFVEPAELKQNTVRKSYLHSVDVEAAVRNGALDVGIFGPVNMIGGLDGAERVVNGLADLILDVGKKIEDGQGTKLGEDQIGR